MSPKTWVFLIAASVTFAADQITKELVIRNLTYSDWVSVIDGFFYFTHVRNPGAAFSMFATAPEPYRKIFFVGMSCVAIAMIFSFQRSLSPGERLSALALGSILGGAAGNLADRLRHGEVVDFLHIRLWSGYSFPDFNLADSFIVIGVALLVLELFASEGEEVADGEPAGTDAGA